MFFIILIVNIQKVKNVLLFLIPGTKQFRKVINLVEPVNHNKKQSLIK